MQHIHGKTCIYIHTHSTLVIIQKDKNNKNSHSTRYQDADVWKLEWWVTMYTIQLEGCMYACTGVNSSLIYTWYVRFTTHGHVSIQVYRDGTILCACWVGQWTRDYKSTHLPQTHGYTQGMYIYCAMCIVTV